MQTIGNIKQLRNSLIENYSLMKTGKMPTETGKQLANTAGKLLSSVKIEMDYLNMQGQKRKIDFLEY